MSSGFRPVRFAIRASILGPISSLSWKAQMNSKWQPIDKLLYKVYSRAGDFCRAFREGDSLRCASIEASQMCDWPGRENTGVAKSNDGPAENRAAISQ